MNFTGFKKKLLIEKIEKQQPPHRVPTTNNGADQYVIQPKIYKQRKFSNSLLSPEAKIRNRKSP